MSAHINLYCYCHVTIFASQSCSSRPKDGRGGSLLSERSMNRIVLTAVLVALGRADNASATEEYPPLALLSRPGSSAIYSHGPHSIDAGNWTNRIDFCPPGNYVSAVRLVYEPYRGSGDDTGVNGIQMQCSSPEGVNSSVLQSAVGPFGLRWTEWATCPRGDFIFQYQLKSEGTEPGRDLVAMTNILAGCRHPRSTAIGVTGTVEPILPSPLSTWGDHQSLARCERDQLVVGLQTRIVPDLGGGYDDMGMSDLRLMCD